MFRASFELTEREAAANPQLYFYQITDYVEVYIDGQKRAEKTGYWNQPLTVPLEGSTGAAGKHQIVVIMELVPSLLHHGITRGVVVRSVDNQLENQLERK